MGKNKHTRKVIAGQLRTIARQEEKIRDELQKPTPNTDRIKQWEKEIDIARRKVRKLDQRVER